MPKKPTKGVLNGGRVGGNCNAAPPQEIIEPAGPQWPEVFAAPRQTAFLLAAAALFSAVVMGGASLGAFTAVKISLAERLGLSMPEMVAPSNYDIAFVLWGLGMVALAGLIHPAFGIGIVLMARSWLDGYTFPADNAYFTWAVYLLCVWWLVATVVQRRRIHAPVPVLIFAAFMVVVFATTRYSIQYFNTYQMLWLWMGYGALLLLTINVTRDRRVMGMLLTVFMVAMAMQAAFSILHFSFLLPHLRTVIQNPAILRQYFNTDTIGPELARRFMVNRAFGTMLFPNALAAYLLLGVSLPLAMLVPWYAEMRAGFHNALQRETIPSTMRERFVIIGIAAAAGAAMFVALHVVVHFPREYRDPLSPMPWYLQGGHVGVMGFALACAAGLGQFYLLTRFGIRRWWLLTRFCGAAMIIPLLLYTLWITYTRGAFLALAAALLWSALLLLLRSDKIRRTLLPGVLSRVLVALILCGAILAAAIVAGYADAHHNAWAQAATPATNAGAVVHREGLTLSMSELADPASFRLRLGYWNVTLRMAMAHWRAGVGLGNFAIAYPIYQYIGAGDVREAHNGFLQMFAETGLVGGLLFALFWAWSLVWGALCIVRCRTWSEALLLTGIYTGLTAFCAHSFLDINFSHPSLMMYALVSLGMFYARAGREQSSTDADAESSTVTTSVGHAGAAIVLILFLIVSTYAGGRVYAQHLALNRLGFVNISSDAELNQRMRTGQFFLTELFQYGVARDSGNPPENRPRIGLRQARLLVNDMETLAQCAVFYKPSPDVRGRFLRLAEDEPVPPNALVVVTKPWLMLTHAAEAAEVWIEELIRQDRRFPHSPTTAMHIAKWYELLAHHAYGSRLREKRASYVSNYLVWAERLAKRNPCHADMRQYYGSALLWPVSHVEGWDNDALIERAVVEFEEMLRCGPISPWHHTAFTWAFKTIGEYYVKTGREGLAQEFFDRAEEVRLKTRELNEERQEARLYQ